jgi:cancer susceptibility candidate protein 1
VGVWDEKEKVWNSIDQIDDLLYDKSAKRLEFTTRKLAQLAYLQSRVTDYPYKKWKLRSVGTFENPIALLDIETKRITLTFEIGPEYLMLIERPESEFKNIVDKKMVPGKLLLQLQQCGINLLPVDEDAKQAGIQLKHRDAEERAILDIATTIRSFSFRGCKWNRSIETDNVVVKIRENLEFDREFYEDHEPDWRYMMWWPNKCAFVRCNDEHEACDTRILAGHETQSILSLAVDGHVTAEALWRCQQLREIDFIETVQKTLRLTRLIAFS